MTVSLVEVDAHRDGSQRQRREPAAARCPPPLREIKAGVASFKWRSSIYRFVDMLVLDDQRLILKLPGWKFVTPGASAAAL